MARMPQTASGAIVTLIVTCCSAIGADRADPPRRQLQSNTPLVVIRKAFANFEDHEQRDLPTGTRTSIAAAAAFAPEEVTISFADDPAPHALRPAVREPASIQESVVPATAIRPAAGQPPAETSQRPRDRRTLGSRRSEPATTPAAAADDEEPGPGRAGPETGSLATIAGGLAIAVGAFLLLVWICRKALPRAASRLPLEAVEVLGKAALTPKQSIHLVRVGNKLVLLSLSPGGVEALTEITDAAQVEQVLAACQRRGAHSATTEFRQVLNQYHAAGGAASASPQAAAAPAAAPQTAPFSLWENRHA